MTIEDELTLSYYKEIGVLDKAHRVLLVQHSETHRLFVKKVLTVFDPEVYQYLKVHPVTGTPRICEVITDTDAVTGIDTLIVIEDYISGTNLADRIGTAGGNPGMRPLSVQEALSILLQLTMIVDALHHCIPPILHRDIKPSNIILTDDGVVRLLDMNAAKSFSPADERDTRLIGTTGFAAPEQYGFGASCIQTDIYAIGVLMAHLLYGDFRRQTLTDAPLDRIIERCTRMDPKDRYPDAQALRSAIMQTISAAPQPAAPVRDPAPAQGTRPVRKPAPAQKESPYFAWLPPGFRRLKILHMLPAIVWYIVVILFAGKLEFKEETPFWQGFFRVMVILDVYACTFFAGNYLNIQHSLRLDQIRPPWLRYLVIAACSILLFFIILVIMAFFAGILQAL